MKLYHGSRVDDIIGNEVVTPDKGTFFYGMFFSERRQAAESHGDFLVTADVDEDDIMDCEDIAYDEEVENKAIELFGGTGVIDDGLLIDLLANLQFVCNLELEPEVIRNINNKIADVTGCDEFYGQNEEWYLDWALQSAACFIAHKIGYKGVAVQDEHGTGFMLVPGEKFERC